MDLSNDDRRALIALWCKVAWADDVIEDAEREMITRLASEIGQGAVSEDELKQWLETGVPFEPGEVSPESRRVFIDKALVLASTDGITMPEEVRTIRQIRDSLYGKGKGDPSEEGA